MRDTDLYAQILGIREPWAGVTAAVSAAPAVPKIGPVRPVPATFGVRGRDLSPLETGWSWTERVVGVEAKIRTSLELGVAAKLPGKAAPVHFWHKRVEFIQPEQGARTGAVVAVAYDKAGAAFAIGELAEGNPERKTKMYDPRRLLMPAMPRAATTWESASIRRRVVGRDLGRRKFPRCIVIESSKGDAKPADRSYLAPGVGEALTERLRDEGRWQVATVLEE